MEVGELWVKLGVKMDEFSSGMDAAVKSLSKMSRQAERSLGPIMDKIMAGLKVAGTAAATGFGSVVFSGLKANDQMEQYKNTLNTVMQDSAKAAQTLDWVKVYAAKTPFEIPELVESTVKLQAMGLEAEKMLPVAADMAAAFKSSGKTVGDATEAINDAMMGEFERLKEFGIKLGAADFKQGGKYAGKSYAEAVLEEVQSHNYTGAAEGLSSTFTGRLSTLKDTLGQIMQQATAPIFDRLAAGMGDLITNIEQLQKSGKLKEWTDQAAQAMSKLWDSVVKVGGFLVSVAKGIVDHWGLIAPVLAGVLAGFLAYETVTGVINAVKVAQAALNVVMAANPIALITLAIAGLVAAGVLLYQNWDTMKAKAQEIWDAIKGAFAGIEQTVLGVWASLKAKTAETWEGVKAFLVNWWPVLAGLLLGPIGVVVGLIVENWDKVKLATETKWNSLKAFVGKIWDDMKAKAEGIFSGMVTYIVGQWESLWERVMEIAENIKNAILEISPFTRHSPSLVEQVESGVKRIGDAYRSLQVEVGGLSLSAAGAVSNNYGGNYITINLAGGSASSQADDLLRELSRRGVRFSG